MWRVWGCVWLPDRQVTHTQVSEACASHPFSTGDPFSRYISHVVVVFKDFYPGNEGFKIKMPVT